MDGAVLGYPAVGKPAAFAPCMTLVEEGFTCDFKIIGMHKIEHAVPGHFRGLISEDVIPGIVHALDGQGRIGHTEEAGCGFKKVAEENIGFFAAAAEECSSYACAEGLQGVDFRLHPLTFCGEIVRSDESPPFLIDENWDDRTGKNPAGLQKPAFGGGEFALGEGDGVFLREGISPAREDLVVRQALKIGVVDLCRGGRP